MRELIQIEERLRVYEHWAIMGKLITSAAQELHSHLEVINRCLLLTQEEKDLAEAKKQIAEALKVLQQMSHIIDSQLACAKHFKDQGTL